MEQEKETFYHKVKRISEITFDIVIYVICCLFVIGVLTAILYYTVKLINENEAFRLYIFGILVIIASGLSIGYILKFNKKYKKDDSDSPERRNDLLFESDIRREEERYINRRNVEQ